MRRRFLPTLLAITLLGFVKGQGIAGKESAVEQEVLKVEEEEAQALVKSDTDALGRICADDLSHIDTSGAMLTKAQFLEELRAGHPKYLTSQHDDIRVRVYGDTAVVTARSTSAVENNGKVSYGPRRFMNVYVKHNGVWRLVAHQGTRVINQ
jgi:hypothetical protein